jgi:hypothetical protein
MGAWEYFWIPIKVGFVFMGSQAIINGYKRSKVDDFIRQADKNVLFYEQLAAARNGYNMAIQQQQQQATPTYNATIMTGGISNNTSYTTNPATPNAVPLYQNQPDISDADFTPVDSWRSRVMPK